MDADEPDAAYREALAWIWEFSAGAPIGLPGSPRRENKLERMRALLQLVGHPERRFPAVLVAGTKGKGSTAAMLSEIMRAAGLKVGRYTSPHLLNWRERTWLDGRLITAAEVVTITNDLRKAVARLPESLGRPTTFEVGTALTFQFFADQAVDLAIVEVGVGGLTDATNTLNPIASVITSVSYDHTQTLGPTLTDIARHKSGVMRSNRPVISAPQAPEAAAEIARNAVVASARLIQASPVPSPAAASVTWSRTSPTQITIHPRQGKGLPLRQPLLGDHQANNLACAVAAAEAIADQFDVTLKASTIQRGLDAVSWPGRLQVVGHSPLLVVDGAHNGDSAQALAQAVPASFSYDKLHVILGLTADKDMRGILGALLPIASRLIVTRSHHERAAEEAGLFALASELTHGATVLAEPHLTTALDKAITEAGPNDLVLLTGSLFLVGEALDWVRDQAASAHET